MSVGRQSAIWNVSDISLKHVGWNRAYLTTITTAGAFAMVRVREQRVMFVSYLAIASTVCSRSWGASESVLVALGSSDGIVCQAAAMMMSSMSDFQSQRMSSKDE